MENIMGWLFYAKSKAHLINDLTSPRENAESRLEPMTYELNSDENTLWVVSKLIYKDRGGYSETFITCHLLDLHKDQWGYKTFDEAFHPFYYDCPLRFLDIAQHHTCDNWRDKVRQWHRENGVVTTASVIA
jgi:hypothetical protein